MSLEIKIVMSGIVAPNRGAKARFAALRPGIAAVFFGKLDFLLGLRYIQLSLI